MICQGTAAGLTELLKFRHAVRNNYAGDLGTDEVFKNVALTTKIGAAFFKDIRALIESFEKNVIGGDDNKGARPLYPPDVSERTDNPRELAMELVGA